MTQNYYDKRDKLIVLIVVSTLLFSSSVAYFLFKQEQKSAMALEKQRIVTESELLSQYLYEFLIKQNYAEAINFLRAWTLQKKDIAGLEVVYKNEQKLFSYEQNRDISLQHTTSFMVNNTQVKLSLSHSMDMTRKNLDTLQTTLIVLVIVISLLIACILWYILTKWIIQPLQSEIDKQTRQIQKIAITDGLTDIYNRRHFDTIFPQLLQKCRKNNDLVSFLMFDVDYFKPYNDTYGHKAGDKVLQQIASVMKNHLKRKDDYCFRIGGEEFAMVYHSHSKQEALEFAHTLKDTIEQLHIEHKHNSASKYVTASFGLVCRHANEIKDVDTIYQEGDKLLYDSKDSGRNKVSTSF
jgi:diguanylate cyclase (GGDEF)-like protein